MKTLRDPKARRSLQGRLNHLRADAPPKWGTMSADQMLRHLNASLRTALGTLDCVPEDTLLTRTAIKWAALFGPWPKGKVKTNREMNASDAYDFEREREELGSLIEEVAARDGAWPSHPTFGPMSGWQWRRLEFRHVDYHLRQFGA